MTRESQFSRKLGDRINGSSDGGDEQTVASAGARMSRIAAAAKSASKGQKSLDLVDHLLKYLPRTETED